VDTSNIDVFVDAGVNGSSHDGLLSCVELTVSRLDWRGPAEDNEGPDKAVTKLRISDQLCVPCTRPGATMSELTCD
jgi:hypothetical protein